MENLNGIKQTKTFFFKFDIMSILMATSVGTYLYFLL